MRVVSWNLHGANVPGRATPEQQGNAWEYARAIGADLILAQEARVTVVPDWQDWTFLVGEHGRFRKTWDWGSVVAAKCCLGLTEHRGSLADPWLAQLYDLVLVGRVAFDDESVVVASAHTTAIPVRDWLGQYATSLSLTEDELASLHRPGCNEPPFLNDLAFTALTRVIGADRCIVAGDWNTCRRYLGGPQFFARARSRGWVECHEEPEEPTFFRGDAGTYQLDHAFIDPLTAQAGFACQILATQEALLLSDHAPLVLDIHGIRPQGRRL
jgi:endonuclease/exonuclease/phosphatase family metal-dependent hydrolase